MELKTCADCHTPKPLADFYLAPLSPDGYAAMCRSCQRGKSKEERAQGFKLCSRCGQWLALGEFGRNKARQDGLQGYCNACRRRYAKEHYDQHAHDFSMRRTYGLGAREYAAKAEAQGHRCAICGEFETVQLGGAVKRLAVDHDHSCCPGPRSCGKCVRGLLCARCNNIIGWANDDIELLTAAADYITYYRANPRTPVPFEAPRERPACGTYAGHQAHIRRGEPSCEPCKTAKREYEAALTSLVTM